MTDHRLYDTLNLQTSDFTIINIVQQNEMYILLILQMW